MPAPSFPFWGVPLQALTGWRSGQRVGRQAGGGAEPFGIAADGAWPAPPCPALPCLLQTLRRMRRMSTERRAAAAASNGRRQAALLAAMLLLLLMRMMMRRQRAARQRQQWQWQWHQQQRQDPPMRQLQLQRPAAAAGSRRSSCSSTRSRQRLWLSWNGGTQRSAERRLERGATTALQCQRMASRWVRCWRVCSTVWGAGGSAGRMGGLLLLQLQLLPPPGAWLSTTLAADPPLQNRV